MAKTNYNKQKIDLIITYSESELTKFLVIEDLVDLIIDAREQRDNYKEKIKKIKKANHSLATKIQKAGQNLEKAIKQLVLN